MKKLCAAMIVLALTGCAARKLHTAPAELLSRPGNEVMVIGRVDGNGHIPVARSEFFDRLHSISLSVRHSTTGDTYDIVCDEKGGSAAHFYATLPPGQYTVTRVRKGEPNPVQQTSTAPYELRFVGGRLSKNDPEGRNPTFEIRPAPAGSPPAVIYVGTLRTWFYRDYQPPYTDFLGIPRPGWAYTRGWDVWDDYDEMVKTFSRKYPQATQAISRSLMKD